MPLSRLCWARKPRRQARANGPAPRAPGQQGRLDSRKLLEARMPPVSGTALDSALLGLQVRIGNQLSNPYRTKYGIRDLVGSARQHEFEPVTISPGKRVHMQEKRRGHARR